MDQSTSILTVREKQVIQLVCRGFTNKEIAQSLEITSRTVEFHLNNIFKKLGVPNRTAAVTMAGKMGLLE